MPRQRIFVFLFLMTTILFIDYVFAGAPPVLAEKYEKQLKEVNIILSQVDVEPVRQWLNSYDSAHSDLAEKCLEMLTDRKPLGDPVGLDVIEERYRELMGKKSWEYIPPPHDPEFVKKAYVAVWKETNSDLAAQILRDDYDYNQAFDLIAPIR